MTRLALRRTMRRVSRLGVAMALLLVTACAAPERLPAVPQDMTTEAVIPGIPNARFFSDTQTEQLAQEVVAARQREAQTSHQRPLPVSNLLAISGGSDSGAFGAGLLVGWTAAGTRPEFKLVTGISTGALTAPFAFLGPDWDDKLTAVFTSVRQSDIFTKRGISAAIFNDALADTSPLWTLVSRYVDADMMAAIAREYGRGRLLLIGTTDLDARRPVVWNIGAIAASGQPGSLDLFRKILLASAAIPAFFPPVMIDVELNGQHYQEMHVDGGAVAQMFLYPPGLAYAQAFRNAKPREVRAWLIRNSRLDPNWASVQRQVLTVAGNAIEAMIFYSGANDVNRIYFTTQRDHVDFNLAYIGTDFTIKTEEPFDSGFMNALYNYARDKARAGYRWAKVPPWIPVGETVYSATPSRQYLRQ
jgi:hypothetical protein